jgi:DNA-binding response OmpR family regulator
LLLVEDNRRLQHTLRRSLVEAGYAVDVADDAEDGQALAEVTAYDVVVLDVMLPRRDGLQVCRELRRQGVPTPILMLTARDAVEDRVRGLDCGADDYLVKPFALGGTASVWPSRAGWPWPTVAISRRATASPAVRHSKSSSREPSLIEYAL